MIFIGGKAIALATNHVININPQVIEERTKDDAVGPVGDLDYCDWDAQADSVLGANESVTAEETYETLIAAQLAGTEVTVKSDAVSAAAADKAVPAAGWAPGSVASRYPTTTGVGLISEVGINAPESGNATLSVKIIATEPLS